MIEGFSSGMGRIATCLTAIACAALAGGASGCAHAPKPPTFMAPGFDATAVDRIEVLPVVDHRIDASRPLALDDWVLPIVEKSLTTLGCAYTLHKDRSAVASVSRDALETPSREFISSLPPTSGNWVLLLALEDSASKLTFGATGNAEMTGYLFDKRNGAVSWRNKAVAQTGQGGLIGMAVKGFMEKDAIVLAAYDNMNRLPYCRKRD